MTTCSKCRKTFESTDNKCPHCGAAVTEASGVFQTSSVMISAGGADMVYRSVEEVPPPLRSQLLKSTNSANSATILIADRRGRKEVSKAVKSLPAPAQKRLLNSLLGGQPARPRAWALIRRALPFLLLLVVLGVVAFIFLHHWQ
jgi:hypothetical protein